MHFCITGGGVDGQCPHAYRHPPRLHLRGRKEGGGVRKEKVRINGLHVKKVGASGLMHCGLVAGPDVFSTAYHS